MTSQEPKIFGHHDEGTLRQIRAVASSADRTALMADGHLGYCMPIGGVAAYRHHVSVAGVGYDIACGNAAIRTDLKLDLFSRLDLEMIANEIQATISFGVGRTNRADDAPVDSDLFVSDAWDVIPETWQQGRHQRGREELREKARAQLGTVGSGNHYVDVLEDDNGFLWVGVHFGSRGLGHTIASGFLALGSGAQWGEPVSDSSDVLLDVRQPIGHDYLRLMELAGEYAHVGREWVARKVVRDILVGEETDLVHNNHNYAWREYHGGGDEPWSWVVRKGATPAFPGQRGFVGGSMGDESVILRGADSEKARPLQRAALFSTVHGAGRVMSRTEAAGKVHRKTGRVIREGKVTSEMMHDWLDREGVILRGGGLDESPHAYRRLPEVIEAQGPTVVVEEVLKPVIVVMAGAGEFDPYKD